MNQAIQSVRQSSRTMVRELGFLQPIHEAENIPHSHCHALLEIDAKGSTTQLQLRESLQLDKSTISRIVADLTQQKLIARKPSPHDLRSHDLSLTTKGIQLVQKIHHGANTRVDLALNCLNEQEQQTVIQGLSLYAKALQRSRQLSSVTIRLIEKKDNAAIGKIIKTVMPEFGADGPGFAIHDPEVHDMFTSYTQQRHAYFVVLKDKSIVGGAGIAPLQGADKTICELRKMYFLPQVRGLGLGQELLSKCLKTAQSLKFKTCYLETLTNMVQAKHLYEKNGFEKLKNPLGKTGHFGCNSWYAKKLD